MFTYSNVDEGFIDGFDGQTSLDGSTGHLGADAHDASRDPTGVIVFVGVTGHPDYCKQLISYTA